MTTQIKITQLVDIGANLTTTTVLPVVNMTGVPTTQKTNLGNVGNIILEGAGTLFKNAALANLAYSVTNAAQPNITSVGTLTSLSVTGNTALGAVGNVTITGGSNGQVLTTNGSNVLSWTTVSGGNSSYGNSNVVTLLSAFGSNIISTTGNITGGNLVTGGQVVASGNVSSGTGLSTGGFLSVDGNADLHDTSVTGNLSATGNVTANAFIGDGSQLTNIPSAGTSGEVQVNWLGSFSNQGGTPGDTYSTLQFDSNGMPTLNGTNAYQQRVDYSPYLQVLAPRVESTDFGIVAGPAIQITGYADNVFYNIPRSAYLSVQDQANATQQWDFGILGNGNNNFVISDRTNSNQWTFGGDGTTQFPANTINTAGQLSIKSFDSLLDIQSANTTVGSGGEILLNSGFTGPTSAGVTIAAYVDGTLPALKEWVFDATGNLTLPSNTFAVNYANGQQVQLGGGANLGNFVFPNPTSNTSTITVNDGSDIVINPTYGGASPAYINVPGNINGPTGEALQIYNGYYVGNADVVAVSIGSSVLDGITIYGDGRVATSNTLTVPASDSGSIIFSSDGTTNNGSLKVDAGLNMTINANSNFYVKQAGQDRLAITNTNTDLMASSNVVIHANKAGSEQNWIFDTTGNLRTPGNVDIYGAINFPQQVSSINWSTYNIELSQYGRINTNVDFFANANVIGAQYLKGDGSNISNINASNITNAYSDSNVISLLSDLGGNGIGNVGNIDISGNINFTNNSAVQQSSIVVNPFRTIETVTLSANSQNNATLLTLEDTGNANLRAWQDINLNTYTQTTNNNFNFGANGNLTIPGNISGSGSNGLMISSNGNVILNSKGAEFIFDAPAGNFYLPNPGGAIVFADNSVQNTAYTGSIAGANVSGQVGNALVAGTVYTNAQPNITSVGTLLGLSVTGNVSANNFTGNGSQLTGIPTQTTGSWTLAAGTNTVSISVPTNGTYSIWVNGNIPNGIVTYTATAVVTNNNVPVLGFSYGWYYAAGNALVLTAIPTQFVGTLNNISNAVVSTTSANVFTFGITNNSGANAVVNWGYTKL
jgi:hypothetical protein